MKIGRITLADPERDVGQQLPAIREYVADGHGLDVSHEEQMVSDRRGHVEWIPPDRPVHASWLSRLPGAAHHYPKLLPLMNGARFMRRAPPPAITRFGCGAP